MKDAFDAYQETSTLSSDGRSWLRVALWLPDAAYTRRGAVQLVHGMAEHIERYDAFARFLTGLGYVVFGHDHIGHGKSVTSADDLGHMPMEGGKDILVEDVARARVAAATLCEDVGRLPLFLFGHSMGSFVVRACIARHPEGLAGAVLCGTGDQPRLMSLAGRALSRTIGAVRGERHRSRLVDSLAIGSYASAIEDARTESDWLSTDPAVVDAYLADPLAGFMFTVGGYAALTDLTAEVVTNASAAAVPHDLPLLFVAGSDDPVGERGAAVRRAADRYRAAGVEDVDVVLYPGMRHEILNEPGRVDVYADIEAWCAARIVASLVAQSDAPAVDGGDAAPGGEQDPAAAPPRK